MVSWTRWEASRRIEMTLGVRLIVLDRTVKFVVLVAGGIGLIVATRVGFIDQLATTVQQQLNLSPGNHLWLRLVSWLLQRFGSLGRSGEYALGIAAVLYGLLEGFEALGLVLRRRWAEYLVLLATVAFIPLEVDELIRHPSVWKGLALLVNVAIVVYLVRRKRLFLDRPPAAPAAAGA
ncbi:MAG: DUF2127 domain-containing protein [Candidatus Dormibacteraeota bacterium]|nr:DUF2127 domain-containing protein [Candidatus Dormibacteraeota bacterium]